MKIVMISEGSFPYGPAATNRLIAYAKGLSELSNNVEILCIKPSEKHGGKIRNTQVSGMFEGIKYLYLPGTVIRPKSALSRILLYLKGFLRTVVYIYSTSRQVHVDAIFMGISNLPVTFVFYLLSRILKIRFVHERSEYPFISSKKSILWKLKLIIYLKFTIKFFDGLIVITTHLEEYFRSKLKKNAKIMILPILVEPERFSNFEPGDSKLVKKITYCGSMEGNKDGITILISAFKRVTTKHKNVKLVLIGDTSFASFKHLKNKIIDLKIEDEVIFTGRVEREEMPRLLADSDMLVLARPRSIQAKGGFPTKLGEYLATGKPVIVTKVGEIPMFLEDNKNAFMAEPDSPDKFAEKIEYVLSHPDKSARVGLEGKKLTHTVFNYKYQAGNLVNFINSL